MRMFNERGKIGALTKPDDLSVSQPRLADALCPENLLLLLRIQRLLDKAMIYRFGVPAEFEDVVINDDAPMHQAGEIVVGKFSCCAHQ